MNLLITKVQLEHHLSALQDETGNIQVLEFVAAPFRGLTAYA